LKCIRLSAVSVVLFLQMLPLMSQVKNFSTVISTKADQYGFVQVIIRNNSKRNMTAAFLAHSCSGADRNGTEVSAVGFESTLYVSLGSGFQDPGIPPAGTRRFEIKAANASCPETSSAIFSDGHCEGSSDGPYGCTQMLADRRAAYAELIRIRSLVQKFSDEDPEYISKLTADLESRRVELSQLNHVDASQQGVNGRNLVLQGFKNRLPPYTTPLPELSTPTQTVKVVDAWMTLLAANILLPQDKTN
jgi:hypothetical protein